MSDVADLLLKIDATTEGLRRELKKAEKSVDGGRQAIDANTKKIDQSFTSMGANVKKVVGVIAVAMGGMAIGRKFADVVVETEKLRGSLTTITGSAENAGKAFDKLTEFAAKTPFTLDQSVNAFIKLKALGLDPSERALLSYGNTSSAMGKDMSQMIEAVADASTGEFERLKEFGIKAKSQGDNVSFTFQGITTTIGKNAGEIQAYLMGIGEVQFAGAMEDQMERLPGLLSNLQDNVDGLFRKMGDTGGINIFGAGITAASGAILYFTENLETIGTVVAAVGAALSVMIAPTVIVGGIGLVVKAVLAMNAAFLANPIGLIVAALAAAAVVIYRNWEDITTAASTAAVNVQIAWEKLKVYLMETFPATLTAVATIFNALKDVAVAVWGAIATAIDVASVPIKATWEAIKTFGSNAAISIEISWETLKLYLLEKFAGALGTVSGAFVDVQNKAIATMTAIAAAAASPLSAINTFNTTFETTLTKLKNADTNTGTFNTTIGESKRRIVALEGKLVTLKDTTGDVETAVGDADVALSDFKTVVDNSATSTGELDGKAISLITSLKNEKDALGLTSTQIGIRNGLQTAGVTSTSLLGKEIVALVTEIDKEKTALTNAATEAAALEKANDEAARAAEEAWGRTHDYLSTTFVNIMNNGKGAFSQIAEAFTGMIKRMVAEWAASKLMNLVGFGGTASTGAGNPISSILGSIGSSVASTAVGGSITSALGLGAAGTVATPAIAAGMTSGMAAAGAGTAAAGSGAAMAGMTSGMAAQGAAVGGTGIMASIGSGVSAVGSGLASAGSAVMGALSAVPVWGWALGGAALLAKVLDDSGTMSSNAGMLTQDLGHEGSFGIDPFASGAQFTGFSRRSDQQGATDNIDAFREVDAYLSNIHQSIAGTMPSLNASDFIGYDEKGEGRGAFFGSASEEGGSDGTPMADQLAKFASRWVELSGAQMGASRESIDHVIGNGSSVAEILSRAGALGVDGSHFNGLRRVPFDGYRAELHKNEEVLTANDPRNSNSGGESAGMINEMRKIAASVKTTADLLIRVTRDGNALVTETA